MGEILRQTTLREAFERLMADRKRAPNPSIDPVAALEYETLWFEAFKATEQNGKWSASRAAAVLGPRASVSGGNWILSRRFPERARNSRG